LSLNKKIGKYNKAENHKKRNLEKIQHFRPACIPPRLVTAILIYTYSKVIFSSRKIAT